MRFIQSSLMSKTWSENISNRQEGKAGRGVPWSSRFPQKWLFCSSLPVCCYTLSPSQSSSLVRQHYSPDNAVIKQSALYLWNNTDQKELNSLSLNLGCYYEESQRYFGRHSHLPVDPLVLAQVHL